MHNEVNSILLVPMSPNSLSFRPICLPSSCTITIKLSKKSRTHALVSYDCQNSENLTINDEVIIKRAEHDVLFYEPKS